jgi:8-oxo-dGTP pyrophosphatase MutT (NUDIX family)
MSEIAVVPLDDVTFTFASREWPFARERRAEITAHFAAKQVEMPALWNGRVLLVNEWSVASRVMRGTYFATDFADFIAWRDWGFPDRGVTNCFAMGAIRTADDAFLLGVMGPHTANAGKIYFPAGTPEPQDVLGGRVDLIGNIAREVAEETGLTDTDFNAESGWTALVDGQRMALMRVLRAHAPADDLRARIRAHLASDPHPELADIHVVRSPADFDPMMPAYMMTYLERAFSRQ